MNASRDVCKEQVLLFRNYHGFPADIKSAEGKAELRNLVDSFEKWCVDDNHARAVGAELLSTQTFCPKPVDIRSAAAMLRAKFFEATIGVSCGNACSGTGYSFSADEHGVMLARYCSCHPGRNAAPPQPKPKDKGFQKASVVLEGLEG